LISRETNLSLREIWAGESMSQIHLVCKIIHKIIYWISSFYFFLQVKLISFEEPIPKNKSRSIISNILTMMKRVKFTSCSKGIPTMIVKYFGDSNNHPQIFLIHYHIIIVAKCILEPKRNGGIKTGARFPKTYSIGWAYSQA
jgi:hypothetical protein